MKLHDVVETSRGTGEIVDIVIQPPGFDYDDEVIVLYDSGRKYTYHPNALRHEIDRCERTPLRAP